LVSILTEVKQLLIVAQNWDRFGGRCHELFNAYLLSKVLETEFGFHWPKIDFFPEMDEQLHYLAPEFVAKYLRNEPAANPTLLATNASKSSADLLQEMRQSGADTFRTGNVFDVPQIKDVNTVELFKALNDEVWSMEAKDLSTRIAQSLNRLETAGTIHFRCGDLVEGVWNQYPEIDKFLPYVVVDEYLRQNHSQNFALISDTQAAIESLAETHSNVVPGKTVVATLNVEPKNLDLADILILKESAKVIGPSKSAYSKLGAHLAGSDLEVIYQHFNSDNWSRALDNALSVKTYASFEKRRLARLLQSRDISWLVDRRFSKLSVEKLDKATKRAIGRDPENVIALCQAAVVALLQGDFGKAKSITRMATRKAKPSLKMHADPTYYAMTIKIVLTILQLQSAKTSNLHLLQTRWRNKRLSSQLQTLTNMNTYQVPNLDIQANLREAVSILFARQSKGSANRSQAECGKLFAAHIFDQGEHRHFLWHLAFSLTRSLKTDSQGAS